MSRNNIYTSLTVERIQRDSEKAYFVVVKVKEGQPVDMAWIPKSQVQSVTLVGDGTAVLMVSEWILGEKGWLGVAAAQKAVVPTVVPPGITGNKDDVVIIDDIPF